MSSATHEIIILGGNFGGIGAAHYLLRHIIPPLQALPNNTKTFHITLVSPNAEVFFKIGSPRALVSPSLIPEEKIFRSISEAFASYSSNQFTFVQALATGLDARARTVTVTLSSSSEKKSLHYDSLIISTGTTSNSPLWTIHPDQSLTKTALHDLHSSLPRAKTVLIGGGGPAALETAGEVATTYPKAKVTLVSGSTRLLKKQVSEAVSSRALTYLEKTTKVEVILNVRVVDSTTSESTTKVTLSDGSTRTVDVYIDATGGKANSSFLPPEWLDDTKRVITRDAYFRVRGDPNHPDETEGVYVIGDVTAGSANTAFELNAMTPTALSSLAVDIAKGTEKGSGVSADAHAQKSGLVGWLWSLVFGAPKKWPVQKEFKPVKGTIIVPIGINGGVGQLFGYSAPSFIVKKAKAKTFLLEMFEPMVTGQKFEKE